MADAAPPPVLSNCLNCCMDTNCRRSAKNIIIYIHEPVILRLATYAYSVHIHSRACCMCNTPCSIYACAPISSSLTIRRPLFGIYEYYASTADRFCPWYIRVCIGLVVIWLSKNTSACLRALVRVHACVQRLHMQYIGLSAVTLILLNIEQSFWHHLRLHNGNNTRNRSWKGSSELWYVWKAFKKWVYI